MRFFFLVTILACEPDKSGSIHDPVDDSGDSATEPEAPAFDYAIDGGELTTVLPWLAGLAPFAGYAGVGGEIGFYVSDPIGDGEQAFVHRIPWSGATGVTVEEAAELTLTTGLYGPDKLSVTNGMVSIPDADATADGVEHAGIAYLIDEPAASGSLADAASYAFNGGYDTGYTGRVIWLDADGDGLTDDIVVTATNDIRGESNGALAVFLDAKPGTHSWDEADYELTACYDHDETAIHYGPVSAAVDAAGATLYVACPSATYADGSVELWELPFSEGEGAYPFGYLYGVGGWTVVADPRGGAWAGSQGNGSVAYVAADGSYAFGAFPSAAVDVAPDGFGADPEILTLSGGQVVMAVGQQTRDTVVGEALAPADEEGSGGSLWLCDISDVPEPDETTYYAYLDCAEYERPSGVPCAGGIQGLHENSTNGIMTIATAGWVFGSGDGCGVSMWQISGVMR